jgi:Ethanolamine utilization protein EutJ (predicted chaperonin)
VTGSKLPHGIVWYMFGSMNERTADVLRAALRELLRLDEPAAPAAMLAVERLLEDAAVDVGGGRRATEFGSKGVTACKPSSRPMA